MKIEGIGIIRAIDSLIKFNFASKASAGVTKNSKDSTGKRLGVKKLGGCEVLENIILVKIIQVRQRGFKWKPGENVHVGKDQTIHSSVEGKVYFTDVKFENQPYKRKIINIIKQEIPNRKVVLNKIFKPPPYNYHPELYPELAKNNPEIIYLKEPKPKPQKPKSDSYIGKKLETKENFEIIKISDKDFASYVGKAKDKITNIEIEEEMEKHYLEYKKLF